LDLRGVGLVEGYENITVIGKIRIDNDTNPNWKKITLKKPSLADAAESGISSGPPRPFKPESRNYNEAARSVLSMFARTHPDMKRGGGSSRH